MRIPKLTVVPFLLAATTLFDAAVAQQSQPEAPAPAEAPQKAAPAKTAVEAAVDETSEPDKIALLRPAGLYADLPEMGLDLGALLGGGGGKPKAFYKFLEMVDDLADAEVDDVLIDLSSGVGMNLPQLRELERALERVRAAGKRLTCYLEGGDTARYQIAAQCDRVLMADMGMLDLRSPAMNVMHFKDALDLLGVQVEVTRVGAFKGAVEPYMLPTMSHHLREHYEAMLSSMNEGIVRRIATGRKLTPEKVRELQAQRLFTAEQALLAGLVDRLVPWTGARRAFAQVHGNERFELENVEPKEKKRRRDLMSIFTSMLRSDEEEEIEDPQIVVLHLAGQIVDGSDASPGSMVSGPSVKRIDSLADNDLVKGVVVRINSPGGSATASEAIRLALGRLAAKKPVVYSMGELAASGGYWITAIGEPILAEAGTITGSIGVFGMRFQPGALMRRLGVHNEIVAIDAGPEMDAMDRPWSPEARERVQGMVDGVYDRFLDIVATSRHKSAEQVDAIAGGRVWSGRQAVELGLVDRLGGVHDAISMVRERAGIDGDLEVRHMPEPTNFADALFGSLFEARLAQADGAVLRAALGSFASFEEVLGVLRQALVGDGGLQVYAMLPSGLRVR